MAAATRLFHERGFHATGMDDIGAAAGITGPGIYRHFKNKDEILETLVLERGTAVVEEVERIAASDLPPREALDALAHSYVTGIVRNPSLSVVAMFERNTLSPETRRWIERMERRNLEVWVATVRRVRPDLTEPEARLVVHATLTMGVSVCNYKSGLDDDTLAGLLHPMVMTAVLGPAPQRGSEV